MHTAFFLASSSARSASALVFTALATISCAALSASATISRAVACASAMMGPRWASNSTAASSVVAAAKASAVDLSSIRFAHHVVWGALLARRTTKHRRRSRRAYFPVTTLTHPPSLLRWPVRRLGDRWGEAAGAPD